MFHPLRRPLVQTLVALCFPALLSAAADKPLFSAAAPVDFSKIVAFDATASPGSDPATVCIRAGHAQSWPGVTLPAPKGAWNLSGFHQLKLQIKNTGIKDVAVGCRIDSQGANGSKASVTNITRVYPGKEETLSIAIQPAYDKLGGQLFGMHGYPVLPKSSPQAFNPADITQLVLFLRNPAEAHQLEISGIEAVGRATPNVPTTGDATPFFPFIDTFGQYKHRTWPGKTASLEDMARKREAETRELTRKPAPADWDQYGGWKTGPQRKATGYFRTEKVGEKWWLIDPEGRLFFSQGITCVRTLNETPVEGRETWFEDFPGKQPEFQEFFLNKYALHGHYAGQKPRCFVFRGANLQRKYGSEWKTTYSSLVHQRLRSWGINTIGNWSEAEICLQRKTPYTENLAYRDARLIEGSEGHWAKFPDVFDPGFVQALATALETKKGNSAGDPWCIGYFVDNEMGWGNSTSLAVSALKSPAGQPAKLAFLADLKAKYSGIEALNTAWGTSHASWDALLASREAPDTQKARADLTAFSTKIAETYFRTVRDEIKKAAPHTLYLGCRFAGSNPIAAGAAAKYCDIVSYNIYQRSISTSDHLRGDFPILIGEFHFGALDRGMFHTGLVPVADQAERARAYRDYLLEAARHPQFVGAHWFQFMDEPLTGRALDEENYQIGFVDVADTPYREMLEASREVAAKMYRERQK